MISIAMVKVVMVWQMTMGMPEVGMMVMAMAMATEMEMEMVMAMVMEMVMTVIVNAGMIVISQTCIVPPASTKWKWNLFFTVCNESNTCSLNSWYRCL